MAQKLKRQDCMSSHLLYLIFLQINDKFFNQPHVYDRLMYKYYELTSIFNISFLILPPTHKTLFLTINTEKLIQPVSSHARKEKKSSFFLYINEVMLT